MSSDRFKVGDIVTDSLTKLIRRRITNVYKRSYEWDYEYDPKENSDERWDSINSGDPLMVRWERCQPDSSTEYSVYPRQNH